MNFQFTLLSLAKYNNTIRLSDATWQLALDFRSNGDIFFLTEFFQTIAHEKRHATLGATVRISTASLRPGQLTLDLVQAQYRVEEIIANAEEIAVGKRMMDNFAVPIVMQQNIRKHWAIIESRVNTTESARLRALIIQQLRNRYGFLNTCDNPITVGVVMCMETSNWYSCFNGTVPGTIPAGLNLCKRTNGTHMICP